MADMACVHHFITDQPSVGAAAHGNLKGSRRPVITRLSTKCGIIQVCNPVAEQEG